MLQSPGAVDDRSRPPGVHRQALWSGANSLGLDVERNVLTVRAERPDVDQSREMVTAERPRGVFSRQLFLGDNLDTDKIEANYHDGVLRLTIPVAEKAKPRRIEISHDDERTAINA